MEAASIGWWLVAGGASIGWWLVASGASIGSPDVVGGKIEWSAGWRWQGVQEGKERLLPDRAEWSGVRVAFG